MRKGFCLLGFIFLLTLVQGQIKIVVPTFGVRGDVPQDLVDTFMTQFRQDIQALGFSPLDSELITPGIAGSLEPEIAYLAADYESVRYVVLGEIQESQTAYTVSILVGDGQEKRSSDLISEPLDPSQITLTSNKLAQSIRDFLQPVEPLVGGSAALFVSSQPNDAVLYINGNKVGRTGSLSEISLMPGQYQLELRKEGYLPETRMVELEEGDFGNQHFNLNAVTGGSLQVFSVPSSEVFIDDRLAGMTPLTVSVLPGPHQVRLQRLGFAPAISEHLVKANRVSRVGNIILVPQFEGMVYWEDAPPLLRLDGIVQTSSYAEVASGTHTVQLSRDGQDISFNFTMPEQGVFWLDFETQALIAHPQ